jgi:hypothetical protein
MSGGWSYPGGAIHDEFGDIAVGSSRAKEEVGVREGQYDKVNQH